MADKQVVLDLFSELLAAFPEFNPKDAGATLAIYTKMLADIPDGVLITAAHDYMVTGKWFPKISELREASEKVKTAGGRSGEREEENNLHPYEIFDNLKRQYFEDGFYDASDWDALVQACKNASLNETAARIEEYRQALVAPIAIDLARPSAAVTEAI